jgi:hypothetical protein
MTMKLQVPKVDGRTRMGGCRHKVIDLDTGKAVGWIEGHEGAFIGNTRYPSWRISLFDGKYKSGFEKHDECVAFAEGVEAVLNHMVSSDHQLDYQDGYIAAQEAAGAKG